MTNDLINEASKLFTAEKDYELRLKRLGVEEAVKDLAKPKKRQSPRILNKRPSKIRQVAADSIMIAGLRGTLGTNLLRFGDESKLETAQDRYFMCLSKNAIMDISDMTQKSQLNSFGGSQLATASHIKATLERMFSYDHLGGDHFAVEGQDNFSKIIKKIPPKTLQRCNDDILKYEATSNDIRAVKDVYMYMSYAHRQVVDQCSEMSLMVKFWTPLLESFFGYNRTVFMQWGDTLSEQCKQTDFSARLDLRIILDIDGRSVEAATGEAASRQSTTIGKLYRDRLKSVLATKCHLNHLLTYLQFIPTSKLKHVFIPIVQIMGLNCSVFAMSLIDKKVYAVQLISELTYPRTLSEIRNGKIDNLIRGLQQVDAMMKNLERLIDEYSKDTHNKMKSLTGGVACSRPLDLTEWTSKVIGLDERNNDDGDGELEDDIDGDDDDDLEDGEDDMVGLV